MEKHPTTATVCKYVAEKKAMSGRALARLLKIDPRTWRRYKAGATAPSTTTKYKLVRFMQTQNFEELIRHAFHYFSAARGGSGNATG